MSDYDQQGAAHTWAPGFPGESVKEALARLLGQTVGAQGEAQAQVQG